MKTTGASAHNGPDNQTGNGNNKKSRAIVASLCFIALAVGVAVAYVMLRPTETTNVANRDVAKPVASAPTSEATAPPESDTSKTVQNPQADQQRTRKAAVASQGGPLSARQLADRMMARVRMLERASKPQTLKAGASAVEALKDASPVKSEATADPASSQATIAGTTQKVPSGEATSPTSVDSSASSDGGKTRSDQQAARASNAVDLGSAAVPASESPTVEDKNKDKDKDKDYGFVALLNKTEKSDPFKQPRSSSEAAAPQAKGPEFRTAPRMRRFAESETNEREREVESAVLQDPSPAPKVEISYPAPVRPTEFNGDLRSLPQIVTPEERTRFRFDLELEGPEPNENKKPLPGAETETSPQVETPNPTPNPPMPATLQSFDGLNFASNGAGWPPDTVGDVGPNHYIQAVNTSFGIYNKTGTLLTSSTFNTLWATAPASGTACDNSHQGDPTVIYSRQNNRWIIADFAFTAATIQNGPYYECIAVSKTADPVAGGWWFFAYRADDAAHPWLPDYPKMAIWPDGLYMTSNMFDCTSAGCASTIYKEVRAFAFNLTDLVTGAPLRSVVADLGVTTFFSVVPSNYRGIAPPVGRENILVEESGTVFGFNVFKFHVDYSGAGSTFTGPTAVTQATYTVAPTTVTSPANSLDSLRERIMMQNQYRNVAGVESLWVNHTVRTGASPAPVGIQWAQLNVTGGVIAPAPVQQQIYGNIAADGVHRWMGALAVDNQGNMALGYSASSATVNPDIRYAGRLLADPLNTLPQTEASMLVGVTRGTQSGTCAGGTCIRWGDYSAMSIDPSDECTFWYTTEYYGTSGTSWRTRIGSFKFPTCIAAPTLAKVNSFTASAFDDGRVSLKWSSAYESDNLGYNVYREVNGVRTKINPQIVAGSAFVSGPNVALTAGRSYDWADQLTAGPSVRYWLENIDLKGNSSWDGPISLDRKSGKAPATDQSVLLSKIGMSEAQTSLGQGSTPVERRVGVASLTPAAMQVQTDLAGRPAIKLAVKQEGWYRASQRDLVNAGFSAKVDPRNLQLYVDGRPVPMIVKGEKDGKFDPTDSIEFFGLGIDSAVTDSHVYWLATGAQPGTRIPSSQGVAQTPGPNSFQSSVERKDRTLYFSALKNGETENFFGPVIGSSPVDQSLSLTNLSASPLGSASLEVAVQGVTSAAHQVKVTLNGTTVGTISFSGQTRRSESFDVPQSLLREGVNSLELVSLGGSSDISLADKARVTYWHNYRADSNRLQLNAQGGQQVTLTGFTSNAVRVMDVTDANDPRELPATAGLGKAGTGALTVNVPGAGQRTLYAFADDQAKSAALKLNTPSSWRQSGQRADLVIFTRQELMASLAPLVALRQKNGLSVAVVNVEDAFDEFSFGNKSPQAMRDLLQYAKSNWQTAPRFVLLAGDASYDPKNYLGYGDSDLVPTKLIDTAHMQTSSDDWLTDFSGNGSAQMATGRLPVRTASEAAALVAKITGYESSSIANSVLLASDSFDGFDFAAANNLLRPFIPAGTKITEVQRGSTDDAAVKAQLLAAINSGAKVVSYIGHGATNQWRGNILTNDDARSLTNGKNLPLFVMMTCLNGYFDDPLVDSLSESLLKASNGGAVLVWASTAQSDPAAQSALNQAFYRELFGTASLTVGEAASRAKSSVTDADVRRTWILFGDPTMRIK